MELITDYSYLTLNIFSVRNLNGCKFFNIGINSYQARLIYIYSIWDQNTTIGILGEAFNPKKKIMRWSRGQIHAKCEQHRYPKSQQRIINWIFFQIESFPYLYLYVINGYWGWFNFWWAIKCWWFLKLLMDKNSSSQSSAKWFSLWRTNNLADYWVQLIITMILFRIFVKM